VRGGEITKEVTLLLYCISCGFDNIDQALFCQNCGASLQATTQETGSQQNISKATTPRATTATTPRSTIATTPRATIDTIPRVQSASFWRRFVAALIDGIPLFFIVFLPILLGSAEIGASVAEDDNSGMRIGAWIGLALSIVLIWLYYAVMESSSKQATLGKMALRIIVTDLDGRRISFGRATVRYFGRIVSTIILFIGFIMIAFTRKKQGLHDMIAGCLVSMKR